MAVHSSETISRAHCSTCQDRKHDVETLVELNPTSWISLLMAAGMLLLLVGTWTWFLYRSDPERGTIDAPDATAFLRGKCGDAMKISLRFSQDRVVEAKYWTDGCRMSSACGAAAAKLSLEKSPEEIADIDYAAIETEVGGLPEEDLHCATLAAATLQEALRAYLMEPENDLKNQRDGSMTEERAFDPNIRQDEPLK